MKYQNIKTGFVFESDSICAGEDWRVISASPVSVKAKEPEAEKPITKPQPKIKTKRTKK